MENQTPHFFLKDKLKSTLFLLVSIAFTLIIVLNIISIIISITKQVIMPITSMYFDAAEYSEEMIEELEYITNTAIRVSFIFSLLIQIPLTILSIGFWKLYLYSKGITQNNNGFKLIRAYFLIKMVLLFIVIGLLGLSLLLTLLIPFLFIIVLFLIAFIVGLLVLFIIYYRKLYIMCVKLQESFYTNENHFYFHTYVKVFMIIGIILIAFSLISPSNIISLISNALIIFVLISIFVILKSYEKKFDKPSIDDISYKFKDARSLTHVPDFVNSCNKTFEFNTIYQDYISDFDPFKDEYEWLDSQNYNLDYNSDCPIQINSISLYKSNNSKLINLSIVLNEENISKVNVSFLFQNEYNQIIQAKNSIEFEIKNNNILHYAIVIPQNSTKATISIDKICFNNNLYWTGKVGLYYFNWNK